MDARVLLDAARWAGAYYLAGYSIECALKSYVLVYIERNSSIIFAKKKYSESCWTHNLEELLKLADLTLEREQASLARPAIGQNWLITKDWSERSRYHAATQFQAENLFAAINDPNVGVLQWLKNYW